MKTICNICNHAEGIDHLSLICPECSEGYMFPSDERDEEIINENEEFSVLNEFIYNTEFMVRPIKLKGNRKNLTKSLYIILTNTKTVMGQVIKNVIRSDFNHASLALDPSFNHVYGFGRNVDDEESGFIIEKMDSGFYKQNDADYVQLELKVTEGEFNKVTKELKKFEKEKTKFKFSKISLILNAFNIPLNRRYEFFCSQFIAFVLNNAGLVLFDKNHGLVRPNDFLNHPDLTQISSGKVSDKVKADKRGMLKEGIELLSEATKMTPAKRKKMEDKILKSIAIADKSGINVDKYKRFFKSMSDEKFDKYMKKFLYSEDDHFYLEILPNKNEPSLKDIKELLDFLKVPLNEYVYFSHDGQKDDPLRTMYEVPIGYIHLRRLQQILSKKNTYSLDINKRNLKTNLVTGDDKIARVTDAENYALSVIEADYALQEFFGARADSSLKKTEMYKQISMYGYTYLKDIPKDISENQVLNTIYALLIGAGIDSDLLDQPIDEEELLRQLQK